MHGLIMIGWGVGFLSSRSKLVKSVFLRIVSFILSLEWGKFLQINLEFAGMEPAWTSLEGIVLDENGSISYVVIGTI